MLLCCEVVHKLTKKVYREKEVNRFNFIKKQTLKISHHINILFLLYI